MPHCRHNVVEREGYGGRGGVGSYIYAQPPSLPPPPLLRQPRYYCVTEGGGLTEETCQLVSRAIVVLLLHAYAALRLDHPCS